MKADANGSGLPSLTKYYTSVRGLSTAVAAVVVPFASVVVGPETATYLFPPLGRMEGPARIGLVALCLGVSLGVYFLAVVNPVKSPSRLIWIALGVSAICLLMYLALYEALVQRVEIPSRPDAKAVYVSVGYHRTDFANQVFGPAASAEDMLRARGPSEDEIKHLWTPESIIIARIALFSTCALTTLALLFVFSFALVRDLSCEPSTASKQ